MVSLIKLKDYRIINLIFKVVYGTIKTVGEKLKD